MLEMSLPKSSKCIFYNTDFIKVMFPLLILVGGLVSLVLMTFGDCYAGWCREKSENGGEKGETESGNSSIKKNNQKVEQKSESGSIAPTINQPTIIKNISREDSIKKDKRIKIENNNILD